MVKNVVKIDNLKTKLMAVDNDLCLISKSINNVIFDISINEYVVSQEEIKTYLDYLYKKYYECKRQKNALLKQKKILEKQLMKGSF